VPDLFAQTLRTGKTQLVGILSGSPTGIPVSQRKLDAIAERLIGAGYQVMLEWGRYRRGDVAAALHEFVRVRCCALVVAFGYELWGETLPPDLQDELARIARSGTPIIGVDAEIPGDWVAVDRRSGYYRATRHLLNLGHRRIAFLGYYGLRSELRYQGYRQALEEAGITADPDLLVPLDAYSAPTDCHWGEIAAEELLTRRPDVTALLTLGDRTAMGAVKAALRMGRRIPNDLSVIGFDGNPEAEFAAVAITTLEQPVREMAEIAVRLLVERLNTREGEELTSPRRIWIEPHLIERASCGPCQDER